VQPVLALLVVVLASSPGGVVIGQAQFVLRAGTDVGERCILRPNIRRRLRHLFRLQIALGLQFRDRWQSNLEPVSSLTMAEDVAREQKNEQGEPETPKANNKLAIGAEVRVSRLNSLVHIRAELGRVYREVRRREGRFPDALTGSRLSAMLGDMIPFIELVEVQREIETIKAEITALKGQPTTWPRATHPDGSSRTSKTN
jgi:hypothetical protein